MYFHCFIVFLFIFNEINISIHGNEDEKQWLYQSENKWNKEWKNGDWTYMETNAIERSRIAVIGGVFIPMFTNTTSSVLDIGCGEGSISDFLNDIQKTKYVGVDLAKEAIQLAKKNRGAPMKFVHSPAHLFKPNHKFDAIVFSDVLYYVEYEKVLTQYMNYLNLNGIIIISIFHQTETLMYENIFLYARKKLNKIDEIDISGHTKKYINSKLEKTAFHIEVYRLKQI